MHNDAFEIYFIATFTEESYMMRCCIFAQKNNLAGVCRIVGGERVEQWAEEGNLSFWRLRGEDESVCQRQISARWRNM